MIEIIPNFHPIFVHYTVALLSIASGLFVISRFLPISELQINCLTAARWSLWLGSFITIFTLLAGWQAYNTVTHDGPSHAAMTNHRNWALVTALLFFILTGWSFKCRLKKYISISFTITVIVAAILLLTTAFKGGEVVYRYGIGVMSLPQTNVSTHEADGDDHGAAEVEKKSSMNIKSDTHNHEHE